MKRIINMDNQVTAGVRQFAIFCVLKERFEEWNGQQTWFASQELEQDIDAEMARCSDMVKRVLTEAKFILVSEAKNAGY